MKLFIRLFFCFFIYLPFLSCSRQDNFSEELQKALKNLDQTLALRAEIDDAFAAVIRVDDVFAALRIPVPDGVGLDPDDPESLPRSKADVGQIILPVRRAVGREGQVLPALHRQPNRGGVAG